MNESGFNKSKFFESLVAENVLQQQLHWQYYRLNPEKSPFKTGFNHRHNTMKIDFR